MNLKELYILERAIKKEIATLYKEDKNDFSSLFGGSDGDSSTDSEEKKEPSKSSDEGDKSKQVSLGKVSSTPSKGSSKSDDEISLDSVIKKLNAIRSGRSFKDDEVNSEMEAYYTDLKDAERKALQAFLTGISQIVTGAVEGEEATEPKDNPTNVKMSTSDEKNTKHVKPNVIKKGENKTSIEDTSPPVSVKK